MTSGIKIIRYDDTDVRLAVQDGVVSDIIQTSILNGHYEKKEAQTIVLLLRKDEVLLELGAGVGFISTVAWATGKVKEVHCFEADPRLIPLIAHTHRENSVKGRVYNEVLTSSPDLLNSRHVNFYIRQNFFSNSLNNAVGKESIETVSVPVRSLSEAIATIKPTVIACDIEGGELGLFKNADLSGVRRIMIETHQFVLRGRGMRDVFNDLHNANFHFDQRFSKGPVSVFSRIKHLTADGPENLGGADGPLPRSFDPR